MNTRIRKKYLLCMLLLSAVIMNGQVAPKLGYGISPAGFPTDFSQFPAFLTEVSNTCDGGVMLLNGSWRDDLANAGHIPALEKAVLPLQPSPYQFTDLSVYAWASYPALYLDNSANPTNNWTNPLTRAAFLQMLIRTADSLSPTYMMIGNEVNFYWEQDSSDYANWASFYSIAYDSVKAHSPATKVGTVFNYEHLSGQGQYAGWNTPYWNALSSMDTSKMDVISITLYPFLNFPTANAIPATYLDPLFNRIGNIPVVFSETGWPADDFGGAWTSSTSQQVDYINKLFPMISSRNVEIVDWLFLNYYMANNNYTFKSVALRDSVGNDYPAFPLWLSHCPSATAVDPVDAGEAFSVYPNPSAGTVHFSFPPGVISGRIIITDALGRTVADKKITNDQELLFDLDKGIYFYHVQSGDKLKAGKFIVQ